MNATFGEKTLIDGTSAPAARPLEELIAKLDDVTDAEGKPLPDVVAGVQTAIATRVSALAGRFVSPPVYFTGGVALQPGMARALEEVLACPVRVAPQPQFTGALGAALLAGERNQAET